jgi:hypothetical protein
MKLNIADNHVAVLASSLAAQIQELEANDDVRLALAGLAELNQKFRSVAELNDSAETRFLSLIVHAMFSHTMESYTKKPEDWYKLNARNIAQFRPLFRKFLQDLNAAVCERDLDASIRAAMVFFHKYFELASRTTPTESD